MLKDILHRIYSLCDHEGKVRYVGITKNVLSVRLKGHLKQAAKGSTHRDRWIKSLHEPPRIFLIEETFDSSRENHWIEFFRNLGCKLTNLTDGGEGITGYRHTEESRARMSAFHKGLKRSESARKNYSAAAKKRWADNPDRRQFYSDRFRGHPVSDETRKKIGEARRILVASGWKHPCTGVKHSLERVEKMREAVQRHYANGGVSARKGCVVSEETRAKLRAAAAKRKSNV